MKLLLLFAILIPFQAHSVMPNDGGSGGDIIYGEEFEAIAGELAKTFTDNSKDPILKKYNLTGSLLKLAIQRTIVRSEEGSEILLEGEEVDDINLTMDMNENTDPVTLLPNLIQTTKGIKKPLRINRTRWREYTLLQKINLVSHSYLGVLGIEKDNYDVTRQLKHLIEITRERIRRESLPRINYYYSYKALISNLNDIEVCAEESPRFKKAISQSVREALGKCQREEEEKKCEIFLSQHELITSTKYIGLRFCEITVIAVSK